MYHTATGISLQDHRLVALLAYPAALVDCHGLIVACSKPFRDHFAGSGQYGLGSMIYDVLTGPNRAACLSYLRKLGREDPTNTFVFSVAYQHADTNIQFSLTPLQPDDPSAGFLCQLEQSGRSDDAGMDYLLEHLDNGAWDYHVPTGKLTVSRTWRHLRGIGLDVDINAPGRRWKENTHPKDRITLQSMFDGQVRGEAATINVQYRYRHMAGHWIWILCRAKVVEYDAEGLPRRIVGTDTDVTTLRRRDRDVLQLTNKLRLAIDVSGIGVWEFDPATNEVHWDDRMLEIYGITDGESIRHGDLWDTHLHPDDLEKTRAYADHCQKYGLDFHRDYRIVRPNGEVRHIRSLAGYVAASNDQGKLVGVNIDVTEDYQRTAELEEARAKLEHDARHDALTGLANRRLLDERTAELSGRVTDNCRYAALHLDLDYFKHINDTMGHAAGDAVLVYVAHTLRELIGDAGLVCRSGGDEFVVLFEQAPETGNLKAICEAIVAAFKAPYYFNDQLCAFGVSVGCSVGQGQPEQLSKIFIQAYDALYAAKDAGRGCYRFYSDRTASGIRPEAESRQQLLEALNVGEITCHLQPQFDAQSMQIVGAEALVRWISPERGVLAPDAFMPAATDLGLADQIDAHVFEQVVALQSRWFEAGISYPVIAMNVSMDRFQSGQLIAHIDSLIAPHHKIAFELLETAFLDTPTSDQLSCLADLKAMGIGIDLDDFGSGHSSVAAMQAVQPDRIKVDQSLVAPITVRPEQLKTLQLLSQMARLEGLRIVMEGLDTQAHLDAIANVDCDLLQGFALARPMPGDAFEALLHPPS